MLTKQKQSGLALIMFMVVMIGFVTVGLSSVLTTSVKQKTEQNKLKNIQVLKEAKEALLSYAVEYVIPPRSIDDMGKLPCPDVTDTAFVGDIEGVQDNPCGARGLNTIGYFPFKTVGIGKLEDSSNECLWYVVSGDYKNQTDSNLLNWDSVGYLNLVDENGNLKHGAGGNDYPIAFIISPGATIGQDRTPNDALPECGASYTLGSYLEGGPNIDYAADLPPTADTVWEMLTTSSAASLDDRGFNDQVIPVFKNELWGRIIQMNDLSFDNTDIIPAAPDPVTSRIELLTQSLAECIAAYGNANPIRQLPYPAPIDLDPADLDSDEYRDDDNYDDDAGIRYGRFPQVINDSIPNQANFVLDTGANSYCEDNALTPYDEFFWKNWKDHFFYVVSQDFDSASGTPADATKCTGANCISVDGKIDKVAAMVIFAGPANIGQTRLWWWDDATATVGGDNKSNPNNYLEGDNQIVYAGGAQNFNLNISPNDYSYCIEYDNTAFTLTAIKCTDLG